jgi:hypothetical protein
MATTTRKQPTLKNTYSTSPRVFEEIQKTLISHAARSVTFDYDDAGRVEALSFALDISGRLLSFRLPARYKNVERIFEKKRGKRLTDAEREQAYRTAWANVRDWLSAQMALIDTQMVEAAEIFLPYMVNQEGETYYEALKERQFRLDQPKIQRIEEVR